MARVEKKRKPEAAPKTPMELLMREHLDALRVRGYSEFTVKNRLVHIGFFIQWAYEHGLREPIEVTRPCSNAISVPVLLPQEEWRAAHVPFAARAACALRVWFRWMTRQNHILHNPASEIELPKLGRSLPKNIFSASEVEQIMQFCDVTDPIGLRDRAILEVLYSTGLRRMEMIALKLYDLEFDGA